MQSIYSYAWLIPMCPCLAATVLSFGLLLVRNVTNSNRLCCYALSIVMLFIAMILSIEIWWQQVNDSNSHCELWYWINFGTLSFQMGYRIDPVSTLMLVLVTTVGVMVMIYTDEYMAHDQAYVRFVAYLSLFMASMLGLVLSPNLVQTYVFWELVGMSSYLLVGFWFTRPSAAYACQKAFVTNRVGDCGLLLGILGLYSLTGSFDFDIIIQNMTQNVSTDPTKAQFGIICSMLLFSGPIAKSAQLPLHVWLPDAMEGPTPISALIHAATMVAAGVFLTVRLLGIFQQFPVLMYIIAWVGGSTALLAATIAVGQQDIKKVLAYSTMSQLGYMMLALGIGSCQAALFHLVTHAYSKALLFLGSGSVIHAMGPVVGYQPTQNQNMIYMGGIRSNMPITSITFLIGTMSLCGFAPFACFWSKDEILVAAWNQLPALGFIAWITAGITAFYMFRMYFLTFEGHFRGSLRVVSNTVKMHYNTRLLDMSKHGCLTPQTIVFPQESAVTMVLPLIVLSVPVTLIGLVYAPLMNRCYNSTVFSGWLHFGASVEISPNCIANLMNIVSSVSIAILGTLIAWIFYGPYKNGINLTDHTLTSLDSNANDWCGFVLNTVYNWSSNRAYIDNIYDHLFVFKIRHIASTLSWCDQWIIDGLVNVSGLWSLLAGESARYLEGGKATAYVSLFITALAVLICYVDSIH